MLPAEGEKNGHENVPNGMPEPAVYIQSSKQLSLWRPWRPISQEPVSCFCSVRRLDEQCTPPDITLVCHRDSPPVQLLMLSAKQRGIGYHFYSLWCDSTGDQTPTTQSQGGHSNYKISELALHTLHAVSRTNNSSTFPACKLIINLVISHVCYKNACKQKIKW